MAKKRNVNLSNHEEQDMTDDQWVKNCKDRAKLDIKTTEEAIAVTGDMKELSQAFDDIVWMAIRYAHGRRTYAPTMVRDACKIRAKFNDILPFKLKQDIVVLEHEIPKDMIGVPSDDLRSLIKEYK